MGMFAHGIKESEKGIARYMRTERVKSSQPPGFADCFGFKFIKFTNNNKTPYLPILIE
jgi:hypothetical protein